MFRVRRGPMFGVMLAETMNGCGAFWPRLSDTLTVLPHLKGIYMTELLDLLSLSSSNLPIYSQDDHCSP